MIDSFELMIHEIPFCQPRMNTSEMHKYWNRRLYNHTEFASSAVNISWLTKRTGQGPSWPVRTRTSRHSVSHYIDKKLTIITSHLKEIPPKNRSTTLWFPIETKIPSDWQHLKAPSIRGSRPEAETDKRPCRCISSFLLGAPPCDCIHLKAS